jgi:hypothetical protein
MKLANATTKNGGGKSKMVSAGYLVHQLLIHPDSVKQSVDVRGRGHSCKIGVHPSHRLKVTICVGQAPSAKLA